MTQITKVSQLQTENDNINENTTYVIIMVSLITIISTAIVVIIPNSTIYIIPCKKCDEDSHEKSMSFHIVTN